MLSQKGSQLMVSEKKTLNEMKASNCYAKDTIKSSKGCVRKILGMETTVIQMMDLTNGCPQVYDVTRFYYM